YFPEEMTDQAIDWLHNVRDHDSEKPWYLYYSTGCSHAPHHVAKEWSAKYKGRFDQGWDKLREETFERQKQLGVVPADAILTPRDESMPAWDSLDENSKRVFSRQMEVYAGYSENADHHVGRLLASFEEMGELDDTNVTDIGPTILDMVGIPQPTHVDGVEQQPMTGVTFADSLADPDAPERHTQQYFENFGNRAMYKDGWWLSMRMPRIPWKLSAEVLKTFAPGVWKPDEDPVELYY